MKEMEGEFDLAKWLAGEMSESERLAFEKSPEYATYAKIKKYSAELEAPVFAEQQLYDNIIATRKPSARVVPLYRNWLSIAVALVILLGLAFFFRPSSEVDYYAENGKQHSFELPDHSQVILNAGSKIHYNKDNWDSNRKLTLDGEAFFHVAKGEKFEVSTALGKVTVLGTQFNVKARGHRFDVTCYEGRVKINCKASEVIITKGQALAFADGNAINILQPADHDPEWLHNKIIFNKEDLSNIIDELSRQYNVAIQIKNMSSKQLFTGILPMKNLDEALQILGSVYHLKAVKADGKIILEPINAY